MGVWIMATKVFTPTSNFITFDELWVELNFVFCGVHFLYPCNNCEACNLWAGCNYRVLECTEVCDIWECCINSDQNLTSCQYILNRSVVRNYDDLWPYTSLRRSEQWDTSKAGVLKLNLLCRAIRRICLLLHTKTVLMPHQ